MRVYKLEEEPARDPFDRSTPEERLATMWALAKEAWAVSGRELPSYARSEAPGQLARGHR